MNDKTNEEKLRILQERLANIQQKKEIHQEEKIQQNKPVAPVFEEELVNISNIDSIEKTPKQPGKKSGCFKYFIISFILFFIILLVGGGFYAYNSGYFDSFFTSSNPTEKEEEEEEEEEEDIIYFKSNFSGNFIIVLKDFNKKEDAEHQAEKITKIGYDCNVLQLSGVSNSEKEIFQTYIEKSITEKDSLGFTFKEATQYLTIFREKSSVFDKGRVITLQEEEVIELQ